MWVQVKRGNQYWRPDAQQFDWRVSAAGANDIFNKLSIFIQSFCFVIFFFFSLRLFIKSRYVEEHEPYLLWLRPYFFCICFCSCVLCYFIFLLSSSGSNATSITISKKYRLQTLCFCCCCCFRRGNLLNFHSCAFCISFCCRHEQLVRICINKRQ